MGSGCLGSDPGLTSFCSVSPLAAWLTIQSLSVPICQTRVALKTYVMRLMMLKGHTCKLEESLDLLLEPRWPLMCAKSLQWCPILCEPMDCSPPGFSVREDFPRQEYRGGLPCPPPGDLPDPGIKLKSLTSPALAGRSFTTRVTWEALILAPH